MQAFVRAQELLRRATEEGKIPSAVLAIGRGDELYCKEVWGKAVSVGGEVPADLDTLYDMASLTKILSTTSVALLLIEEGRLCLADTLGDYFDAPKDKAAITVEELMTHSSGLPSHLMLRDLCSTPADAANVILNHPVIGPRGGQVVYSCMGYILLGKIVEKITGMPLNEAAKKYVFDPLGMKHTGYLPTNKNVAATEFDPLLGRCHLGEVHDENAYFLGGVSGNAGLFSCIDDCILYASMLSRGGKVNGEYFFSPATLREATRNRTPQFDEGRGLGFKIKAREADYSGDLFPVGSFGHTGFTGTSMIVDPNTGLYVVLLSNRVHPTRENGHMLILRHQVHNAIMAEFTRKYC